LGRNINVQMRRIVSANVSNSFEIFNVTEMDKLRWVVEATREIPDDAAGLIKRNKKTSPVVCNISPEPAFAKRFFFLAAGKFLLCARFKENIVYFSEVIGKINEAVSIVYCWPHLLSSFSWATWCRRFSGAGRVWNVTLRMVMSAGEDIDILASTPRAPFGFSDPDAASRFPSASGSLCSRDLTMRVILNSNR
jgi:hypothetical protein